MKTYKQFITELFIARANKADAPRPATDSQDYHVIKDRGNGTFHRVSGPHTKDVAHKMAQKRGSNHFVVNGSHKLIREKLVSESDASNNPQEYHVIKMRKDGGNHYVSGPHTKDDAYNQANSRGKNHFVVHDSHKLIREKLV